MICHATGTTPSRQFPRRNFCYLHTPLGPLWFRNEQALRDWVDKLSPEASAALDGHDPYDTPGLIALSPRPTESEATND